MGDKSSIEWTDATYVDRGGRRVRRYRRADQTRPGQQMRRAMAVRGLKWCRDCAEWLTTAAVGKNGLCRPHENAAYRRAYAAGGAVAIRARVHARARGVDPVPTQAAELLHDTFGGLCAYCRERPATTWDHIEPVVHGGQTVPGNLVPACSSCNSSKCDRDVFEWMAERGCPEPHAVLDVWILGVM